MDAEDCNNIENNDVQSYEIKMEDNSEQNKIETKIKRTFKGKWDVKLDDNGADDSTIYKFRKRNTKLPDEESDIDDFEESYQCKICYKTLPSKTGRLNHMRMHQKTIKFKCSQCYQPFDTNTELKAHKSIHNDVYKCEDCKLAFTDHYDYVIHKLQHMKRTLYSCPECNKYFKHKKLLITHLVTHYEGKKIQSKLDNLINCVECGNSVKSQYMKRHMLGHTKVKLIQCLYCGKCFITKQSRVIHTRIHTNDKRYECGICHQKFVQLGDRNKHVLTHNSEKNFQCDICSKKFYLKRSLLDHKSVHMKTERYKCLICNKGISTHAGYKMHMIYKHTDDKLFNCNICDMKFKTKQAILRHYKSIQHKNNEYGLKLKTEGK